jgi:hypothetical protein
MTGPGNFRPGNFNFGRPGAQAAGRKRLADRNNRAKGFPMRAFAQLIDSSAARARSDYIDSKIRAATGLDAPVETPHVETNPRRSGSAWDHKLNERSSRVLRKRPQ